MKYYALCHMLKSGFLEYHALGEHASFEEAEKAARRLVNRNQDIVTVVWISDEDEVKHLKASV